MKMKYRFTLQELVLIVATLAVAGTLAASAQKNAPGIAKRTACAANLKAIAAAGSAYAADHGGSLPGTESKVGVNWQMRLASYLGYRQVNPGWAPAQYPLYQCPSDKVSVQEWIPKNGHAAKISYCANLAMIDFDQHDANLDGHCGGRNLKTLKTPGSVILFAELHDANNALRYGPAAKCFNPGFTYEYGLQNGTIATDDAKAGYHDYKNNWAFADGSVRPESWDVTVAKDANLWIPELLPATSAR